MKVVQSETSTRKNAKFALVNYGIDHDGRTSVGYVSLQSDHLVLTTWGAERYEDEEKRTTIEVPYNPLVPYDPLPDDYEF